MPPPTPQSGPPPPEPTRARREIPFDRYLAVAGFITAVTLAFLLPKSAALDAGLTALTAAGAVWLTPLRAHIRHAALAALALTLGGAGAIALGSFDLASSNNSEAPATPVASATLPGAAKSTAPTAKKRTARLATEQIYVVKDVTARSDFLAEATVQSGDTLVYRLRLALSAGQCLDDLAVKFTLPAGYDLHNTSLATISASIAQPRQVNAAITTYPSGSARLQYVRHSLRLFGAGSSTRLPDRDFAHGITVSRLCPGPGKARYIEFKARVIAAKASPPQTTAAAATPPSTTTSPSPTRSSGSGKPSSSNPKTKPKQETTPKGPANSFPVVSRGTGTENTAMQGLYGSQQITIQSALAFPEVNYGGVWIVFLLERATCSTWDFATPDAVYLQLDIAVTPDDLPQLPVGEPLQGISLWWVTQQQGSGTHSDEASSGSVTLVQINTHANGYWQGRLSIPTGSSSNNQTDQMTGTFAARWCGSSS